MICTLGTMGKYYIRIEKNGNIKLEPHYIDNKLNIINVDTLPTLFHIRNIKSNYTYSVKYVSNDDYLVIQNDEKPLLFDKEIMHRNKNFYIDHAEYNTDKLIEYFRKNT